MRLRLLTLSTLVPAVVAGLLSHVLGNTAEGALRVAVGVALAALVTAWVIPGRWAARVEHLARRSIDLLPTQKSAPDGLSRLEQGLAALSQRLIQEGQHRDRELGTLSAVLDSMAEGVWITDAQGTVVRHNRALSEILPQRPALVGQRPLDVVRNSELHEAVMRACGVGEATRLELALEGGRTLAVRVAPLGPDLPGSTAVFRDVTELRRLEKIRQDFVGNVSHELRTPITAILGYAETLRSGALQDAEHAPGMVEVIHRQSLRLSRLVSDLLDLATLDARQLSLESEPVSLSLAASRAAEVVGPTAEGKQIRILLEVPGELSAQGDVRAIEQVLINLLDNAIKYTPAGGHVEVSGAERGEACVLLVRDSGIGIEAKHLPRLFERFYRVDRGRSREMGGTGLGLSIVKHLVSGMGGDVYVTSEPGRGTTFTVQLPRVEPAHDPASE